MAYSLKCTELSCQQEIALDDANARCSECGFPYCADHIHNHVCDGLVLSLDIDLLEEWEV